MTVWVYDCPLNVNANTIGDSPLTNQAARPHGVHMFTEMLSPRLKARVSESSLLKVLSWPQGVDSFTEVADRSWTQHEGRATVTAVRWQTPRSVTLTLRPNALGAQLFADFRAGQHINVAVEIDGRRHTRCYSPVAAEGSALIELTIGRHDGGLVSDHLYRHARPGTVVGIGAPAGDFVLDPTDARILLVSGGSGITPVLSMLRTLRAGGHTGEVAFVHYAPHPRGRRLRRRTARAGRRRAHHRAVRLHPLRRRRTVRPPARRAPGHRVGRPGCGLRLRPRRAGRRGARGAPRGPLGELRAAGVSPRCRLRRPGLVRRQRGSAAALR
jgi:ferredoxin-NADP reductase